MKIELVGGPRCGEVVDVRYIDHEIEGFARYRRRDRGWALSGPKGGCYGEKGFRMYDYVKPGPPA